jgi:hypothetical protein
MKYSLARLFVSGAFVVLASCGAYAAGEPGALSDPPPVSAVLNPAVTQADYVGDKRCAMCHKDAKPELSGPFHTKSTRDW